MGTRSLRAQWTNTVAFAAIAGLWFVLNRSDGGGSFLVPLVLLGIAIASLPLLKRKSISHKAALDAGNGVVVYHRPGCTFCIRMKAMLGPTGHRATWVDIWDDDEAAAFVRSVNDGDETVPTVVINGQPHTNPNPSVVREALDA